MWMLRFAVVAAGLFCAGSAFADDWTAVRLRGQLLELVDKQWQPVARGTVVPDGTVVRSLGNGYADFVRGSETVSVSPNTELQIADQAAAGSKPFTIVTEYFGTVTVEADVEKVQHFAVATPYLAAVVKGTIFTVSTGQKGGGVSVSRGHVEVISASDHSHTLISVGQSAWIAKLGNGMGPIVVTGQGALPSVTGASGQTLPPVSQTIVTQTLSALHSVVGDVGAAVGNTVQSLGKTVSGAVTSVTGSVGSTVNGVAGAGGSAVSGVAGTVGNVVSGTVGGLTGGLGHLLGRL